MTIRATGPFDVKMAPLPLQHDHGGAPLARLSLDKTFSGDLIGTSAGEMLSAATSVNGSAGYVAMERVTGTLHGKAGTFVLQHSGVMTRGTPSLSVTVVPDSGTGDLTGLSGTMAIEISAGKHAYVFDYTLSASV